MDDAGSLVLVEAEVLSEDPASKVEYLSSFRRALHLPIVVLHHNRQLTVPQSQQAPVIDVRRAYDAPFVIDDHQLAVHIDDLGDWLVVVNCRCPQSEEKYIIIHVEVGQVL